MVTRKIHTGYWENFLKGKGEACEGCVVCQKVLAKHLLGAAEVKLGLCGEGSAAVPNTASLPPPALPFLWEHTSGLFPRSWQRFGISVVWVCWKLGEGAYKATELSRKQGAREADVP